MACIEPDGSLTVAGAAMVKELAKGPLSPPDIASALGEPVFKVRGNLRELSQAGIVEEKDGLFHVTDEGKAKL